MLDLDWNLAEIVCFSEKIYLCIMVWSCCAYGCTERAVKGGPVTFHCFPKDAQRRRIWELKLCRENFKASNYSKLCSKHFTPDCFDREKYGGTWLKKTAVPTIFNFPKHFLEKETLKPAEGDLINSKDIDKPCDTAEYINSEISMDEMEEDNSTLLDMSMNEKFYSLEQLETSINGESNFLISNPKCPDIVEKKNRLQNQLKAKIFLKTLKKQWLDAEIKAATAKKDYYETKKVILTKLQNDLNLENSSNFETNSALQKLKSHLKKEELASSIEKRILKQQLAKAKIAADNSQKEYYEAEFKLLLSDDIK